MKKIYISAALILISFVSFGQTKVNFSSFDAWRQNSSTRKMEFVKTLYEPGYIEVNNRNSTAIVYNKKNNQKELFQFIQYKRQNNGNYIAFGKVNSQHMITFIPENNLLLLKVNDIVIMQFSLTYSDVVKLKNELR